VIFWTDQSVSSPGTGPHSPEPYRRLLAFTSNRRLWGRHTLETKSWIPVVQCWRINSCNRL